MRRVETGFVPVGENDQLVGAITDRDIVIHGIAQGKNAESVINEVMSKELLYCFALPSSLTECALVSCSLKHFRMRRDVLMVWSA